MTYVLNLLQHMPQRVATVNYGRCHIKKSYRVYHVEAVCVPLHLPAQHPMGDHSLRGYQHQYMRGVVVVVVVAEMMGRHSHFSRRQDGYCDYFCCYY